MKDADGIVDGFQILKKHVDSLLLDKKMVMNLMLER